VGNNSTRVGTNDYTSGEVFKDPSIELLASFFQESPTFRQVSASRRNRARRWLDLRVARW
jgi:hypothetical protein